MKDNLLTRNELHKSGATGAMRMIEGKIISDNELGESGAAYPLKETDRKRISP